MRRAVASLAPAHRKRGRDRALAIGFSAAVHVLIIVGLGLGLRSALAPEPAAIEVRLVSADVLQLKPPSHEKARPQAPARPRVLAQTAQLPSQPAPILIPAPPPSPEPAAPSSSSSAIRQALREAFGCENAEFYELSDSERARCREHLAAIGRSSPTYAALPTDAAKAAALERSGAANEAWRYYRATISGVYPGLRCLNNPECTPLQGASSPAQAP